MKKYVAMALLASSVLWGCGQGADEGPGTEGGPAAGEPTSAGPQADLASRARAVFAPVPTETPDLEGNPITPAKVELGKMLYFEPRLSSSWLISCNTCHNMGLGGVDLMETSIGHGWQKGPRNAPTVLNAVFNLAQFWDGRAVDLAEQAMGPVQAGVEMNNTPDRAIQTLKSIPQYVDRFGQAFPADADPVTFENMALAIEAFEATLLTPNSPLDRLMAGETDAMTAEQQAGLELFLSEGCTSCHNGVNLGGTGYFPFGLVHRPDASVLPPEDKGRFAVTRTPNDEYVFKAPSLRNIVLTPPYFHSGKVRSLNEAVRIMGNAQLGADLTEEEAQMIVDYLGALTGDQPKVEYPVLPPSTATTPPPDVSVGSGATQ